MIARRIRRIVFGYGVLRGNVHDLLAQVEHVSHTLDDWPYDVDPGCQCPVIASKSFDHEDFLLAHKLDDGCSCQNGNVTEPE